VELWLDIHLSPKVGQWIQTSFGIRCVMMRDQGMQRTADEQVFEQARRPGVVIMTKDSDFLRLLDAHGPPPALIWLTCGNTSNASLCDILAPRLARAMELIAQGEVLIEIGQA